MQHQKRTKKKKSKPSVQLDPQEEALTVSLLETSGKSDPAHLIHKIPNANVARAFIERLPLNEESSIPIILAFKNAFKDKYVLFGFSAPGLTKLRWHRARECNRGDG